MVAPDDPAAAALTVSLIDSLKTEVDDYTYSVKAYNEGYNDVEGQAVGDAGEFKVICGPATYTAPTIDASDYEIDNN